MYIFIKRHGNISRLRLIKINYKFFLFLQNWWYSR